MGIKNIDALQEYLKDGKLSEYEARTIHTLLGYEDKELFLNDFKAQQERVKFLNRKYDLQSLTTDQKRTAFEESLDKITFAKNSKMTKVSIAQDPCEAIRQNCVISVAAVATTMHIGCAVLDITVVAGLVCHGAAIAYQYTAGNNCNLESQQCKGLTTVE